MRSHSLIGVAIAIGASLSPMASWAASATMFCQGGQSPTTFTNVILRQRGTTSNAFRISNVTIFNESGTTIYNGIPSSVSSSVPPNGSVGFSTKDILSAGTGGRLNIYVTIDMNLPAGSSTTSLLTSANFDTDSAGSITTRDTNACMN